MCDLAVDMVSAAFGLIAETALVTWCCMLWASDLTCSTRLDDEEVLSETLALTAETASATLCCALWASDLTLSTILDEEDDDDEILLDDDCVDDECVSAALDGGCTLQKASVMVRNGC